MRVSTLLALVFATVATASTILPRSSIDNFPKCAHSCLLKTNHHGCKQGDDKCLCHKPQYQQEAQKCILGACHGADLIKCQQAQKKTCHGKRDVVLEARSSIDNFPQCARSCLEKTNHHGCNQGDDKCLCHKPEYQEEAQRCILGACHGADLVKCHEAQEKTCHNKRSVLEARSAVDNFPQCARGCLEKTNHHGCKQGDDKCLCKNSAYQSEAQKCILGACHGADLLKCHEAQKKTCHN